MYGNQAIQAAAPRTTLELFKYIGKKLPKQLAKAIPLTIAVGVISWLLHTYLLVKVNEGFEPGTWLAQNFLNVRGSFLSSTLLWAMIGGLITMFVSSILQGRNPFKTFVGMFLVPVNIVKKTKEIGNSFVPVLLIACGVTLLFEKLLSGVAGLVAGGILLSSVAALAGGSGGIIALIFRMIFTDVQEFFLKKQKLRMDNDAIYMILGASGLAFALFGFLQTTGLVWRIFPGVLRFLAVGINFILSWSWLILLVLGIILIFTSKKPSNTIKTMIFFAIFFTALVAADRLLGAAILADDGGWAEAGGTFGLWIASEGAMRALLRGIPPSLAGILGAFLVSILSGLGIGVTGALGGAVGAGVGGAVGGSIGGVKPPVDVKPVDPQPPLQNNPDVKPKDDGAEDPAEKERIRKEQEEERRRKELEKKQLEFELQQRQEEARRQQALQAKLDAERKQLQATIDRLCKKYNTTPDQLRSVLMKNRDEGAAESAKWNAISKVLWVGEKMATVTVVVADTMIDGMASVGGPGAKAVRAGYKIVKGAASSGAENGWTRDNILGGAVSGTADAITDVVNNPYGKAAITIAGETASGAITGGADGAKDGFVKGVFSAGVNAGTDKLAGNGYGNQMETKFNTNGTATVSIKTDGGWVEKTVSGSTAIKFENNKLGNQLTTSAIKGTVSMGNELAAKPVLQDAGILPE